MKGDKDDNVSAADRHGIKWVLKLKKIWQESWGSCCFYFIEEFTNSYLGRNIAI